MTEEERKSPSLPPEGEPDYLRRTRNLRLWWDLVFPPLVGLVALVLSVVVLFVPSLRSDASLVGGIGATLLALAGLGYKKKSQ